jgi:hypothetical protein
VYWQLCTDIATGNWVDPDCSLKAWIWKLWLQMRVLHTCLWAGLPNLCKSVHIGMASGLASGNSGCWNTPSISSQSLKISRTAIWVHVPQIWSRCYYYQLYLQAAGQKRRLLPRLDGCCAALEFANLSHEALPEGWQRQFLFHKVHGNHNPYIFNMIKRWCSKKGTVPKAVVAFFERRVVGQSSLDARLCVLFPSFTSTALCLALGIVGHY